MNHLIHLAEDCAEPKAYGGPRDHEFIVSDLKKACGSRLPSSSKYWIEQPDMLNPNTFKRISLILDYGKWLCRNYVQADHWGCAYHLFHRSIIRKNAQVTYLGAGTDSDLLSTERDNVPVPPVGVEVCCKYGP